MTGEQHRGSVAYRKNRDDIWSGKTPEKYRRLMPFIETGPVLEIGAAEGVLALMLADRGFAVTALELRQERHEEALRLQEQWARGGFRVADCRMICGDVRDRSDLLAGVATVVAIRSIYYLRDDVDAVFAKFAENQVRHVVLSGNRNRANRYAQGRFDDNLGRFNFYASVAGMRQPLERAGYRIEKIVTDGDPIVVGVRE